MTSHFAEDDYLRLKDENMRLKKKNNEQQDLLKKLSTKFKMVGEKLHKHGVQGLSAGDLAIGSEKVAMENEVLELRTENGKLRKRVGSLNERCASLKLQKEQAERRAASAGHGGARRAPPPRPTTAGGSPLRQARATAAADASLDADLRSFASNARDRDAATRTTHVVDAMRARLHTSEKQLACVRQENEALQGQLAVSGGGGMQHQHHHSPAPVAAPAVNGSSDAANAHLVFEARRELRERTAQLTLLQAEHKMLSSKADAERRLQEASVSHLEEFNRTIRDLRMQLQQSQREQRSLEAQAGRVTELEEEAELSKEQLRRNEQRMAALVESPFMSDSAASRESRQQIEKLVTLEKRDQQQSTRIKELLKVVDSHHQALVTIQQAAATLRAEKDAVEAELMRLRETTDGMAHARDIEDERSRLYASGTAARSPSPQHKSRRDMGTSALHETRFGGTGINGSLAHDDGDVDSAALEQALGAVKRAEGLSGGVGGALDFLEPHAGDEGGTLNGDPAALRRALHRVRVAHLTTQGELERCERMLAAQVAINRDLNTELEEATVRRTGETATLASRLDDFEKLAAARLKKIASLEAQLKDHIYGVGGGGGGFAADTAAAAAAEVMEDGEVVEPLREDNLAAACAGDFGPGENLLEVWVVEAGLDSAYVDAGAHTFMMVDFFDYESQPTQLEQGLRPKYDFSATFRVGMSDFLLRHLLTDSVRVELNVARHADFALLGACTVPLHPLLASQGRVECRRQPVYAVAGSGGAPSGTVVGWVRLQMRLAVPVTELLELYLREHPDDRRLHAERKMLAAAAAPVVTAVEAPGGKSKSRAAAEDAAGAEAVHNTLEVCVEGCEGLVAHDGGKPSCYVHYQLMRFPDVFTDPVPAQSNPVFSHRQRFPLKTDEALLTWLERYELHLSVFDDNAEQGARGGQQGLLGTAVVPCYRLVEGRSCGGRFELFDDDSEVVGAIDVKLGWIGGFTEPGQSAAHSASVDAKQAAAASLGAEELSQLLALFGAAGDGSICYKEFLLFAMPPQPALQLQARVREATATIHDAQAGGQLGRDAILREALEAEAQNQPSIGLQELTAALRGLRCRGVGNGITETAFQALQQALAADGSGRVPLGPLMAFLAPQPPRKQRLMEEKLRSHFAALPPSTRESAPATCRKLDAGGRLASGRMSRLHFKQALQKLGLGLSSVPRRIEQPRGDGHTDDISVDGGGVHDAADEEELAPSSALVASGAGTARVDQQRRAEKERYAQSKAQFDARMAAASSASSAALLRNEGAVSAAMHSARTEAVDTGARAGMARDAAATHMQKAVRGHSARKEHGSPGDAGAKVGKLPISHGPVVSLLEVEVELKKAHQDGAPQTLVGALRKLGGGKPSAGIPKLRSDAFFAAMSAEPAYEALSEAHVRAVTQAFDDGSGAVDAEAFLRFLDFRFEERGERGSGIGAPSAAVRKLREVALAPHALGTFQREDSSGSGVLSLTGFAAALSAELGADVLTSHEVKALAYLYDLDGDFVVHYAPLVAYASSFQASRRVATVLQNLRAHAHHFKRMRPQDLFKHFDKEETGRVTIAQFGTGLTELGAGMALSQHELRQLFSALPGGTHAAGQGDGGSHATMSVGAFVALMNAEGGSGHGFAEPALKALEAGELQKRARNVVRQGLAGKKASSSGALAQAAKDARRTYTAGFEHYDWRRTGSVQVAEFCSVLQSSGFAFTHAEELWLANHFAQPAASGAPASGRVTYAKFVKWATDFGPSATAAEVEAAFWPSLTRKARAEQRAPAEVIASLRAELTSAAQQAAHVPRRAFRRVLAPLQLLHPDGLRLLMDSYDPRSEDKLVFGNFVRKGAGEEPLDRPAARPATSGGSEDEPGAGGGVEVELDAVMARLREVVRTTAEEHGGDFHVAFEHFAGSGDDPDTIDTLGFQRGLRKLKWPPLTQRETQRLMAKFGDSSRINFRHFLRALAPASAEEDYDDDIAAKAKRAFQREAEARGSSRAGDAVRVFRAYDRDGTGKITARDFRAALSELGVKLSSSEAKRLMARYDVDGDGGLSYAEFVSFLEGETGAVKKEEHVGDRKRLLGPALVKRWRAVVSSCVADGVDYRESFSRRDNRFRKRLPRRDFEGAVREITGTRNALRAEEEEELCNVFEAGDKKGTIDYVELLNTVGPKRPHGSSFWRSEEELRNAVRKKAGERYREPSNLDSAFAHFDTSGNNYIGHRELSAGLDMLELNIANDAAEQAALYKAMDLNGDGRVSIAEFSVFVRDPNHWQVEQKLVDALAADDRLDLERIFPSGSDIVRYKDFARALQKLRLGLSDDDTQRIAARFSTRDTGNHISVSKFLKFASRATGKSSKVGSSSSSSSSASLSKSLARKLQDEVGRERLSESAMKRVFKAYDRDHAHAVQRRDFERGLKDLRLDRAFSSSEQRELAKAFEDVMGDVKYGSFVDAALGKGGGGSKGSLGERLGRIGERVQHEARRMSAGEVEDEFRRADRSGRGELSERDFERCLEKLDLGLSRTELRDVTAATAHGHSHVAYQAFVDFLGGSSSSSSSSSDPVSRAFARLQQTVRSAAAEGTSMEVSFDHFATRRGQRGISETELCDGLKRLDIRVSRADCAELMERFRCRTPDLLTLREFEKAMGGSGDRAEPDDMQELATKVQRIVRRKYPDKRDLEDLFEAFDANRDGSVDKYEFEDGLKQLRLDLTRTESKQLMKRFDVDGSGTIDYREFADFAWGSGGKSSSKDRTTLAETLGRIGENIRREAKRLGRREVEDGFRHADRDGRGELSERDFERCLDKLDLQLSKSDIRRVTGAVRSIGRGKDYMEFVDFVTSRR
jgi:Ca2+-binding EF-hand superfamily protein